MITTNNSLVEKLIFELLECYSFLSWMSSDDSQDDFDDQKLLEAVIRKGINIY
jgi:hypothetical protein